MQPSLNVRRPPFGGAKFTWMPGHRKGEHPPNYGLDLPPTTLTPAEVTALLKAASRRTRSGKRIRCWIGLAYSGLIRAQESLDMFEADLDLDNFSARVVKGKGGKYRTVALDAQAVELTREWIAERRRLGISARKAPLFCTIAAPAIGKPWWESHLRETLKALGAKAGIEKRVHPHAFRHSGAFHMLIQGYNLVDIQHQMGHERLDTTAVYVDKYFPLERIKRLSTRTWGEAAEAEPTPDPFAAARAAVAGNAAAATALEALVSALAG